MIKRFLGIIPTVVLVLTACTPDAPEPSGMVIVNARVIDGSGGPSRDVNVRVVGDRIANVGDFEPSAEDDLVDADGLVLAPGFIDTHSHHDDGLFELPAALAAVSQGVTTIAGGQDGGQIYPLAEFFATLETSPVAINVASYAGHGTLRHRVMGEDYRRHATPEELAEMVELLRAEMKAGALGLSTGLEYDPGSFSSTEELVALATEAALHGGRYISHIRSEDQYYWEAIDEVITVGREARIPVQVTHIKLAMTRWWGQTDRLLNKLDDARAAGVDITADIYPYRAWNSGFSWLMTVFPDRDLDRRDGAEYILRDMLSPEGILLPDYLPEPAYNGMTIAEIAAIRESDPETTLMELLKADVDMGSQSSMLGYAMDEPDIESIMAWPHTVIGSDGELAGVHPRGFGAFTRFLGHYIRERNVMSLEEGIRRMTSLSAHQIGIAERGSIQVGYYADLVLFDPETVKDRSTPEAPHVPSAGIEKVWVNGQLVIEGGQITGNRPGKPVWRQSSKNLEYAADSHASEEGEKFEQLVDRYLDYKWKSSPETATRSGIHDYDSLLSGMSQQDFSKRSETLRDFIQELEGFDEDDLDQDQQVDLLLIRSDARVRRASIDIVRDWERNPTMYIPFSSLNDLVNGEFGTDDERADALLARLRQVPRVLDEGKQNLRRPPRLFTETAIRTASRLVPFFETSIPEFASRFPNREAELNIASEAAKEALLDYLEFLEGDLLARSDGSIAVGKETYDFLLRELHMLGDDSDSLLRKGEQYFDEIEQLLNETAHRIDPQKTWQEITEDLRADHPTANGLLDAYCDEIQRSRSYVVEQGLVTVPANEEVRCLDTPPSQRAFSPFGVFRQPPPFSNSKVGYLLLHPIDSDLSADATEKMLRAHDFTWISVIAPHESYPGHHLQALKAQENPRPFRKVYNSPVFSEGWGLYTEELMYETGFFKKPELTRLTQLRLRLWRAARIILDVKLHTGQITYEDARQFLVDKVGFEESSTAGEVNIYIFRPSYAIAYVVGFVQIMELREEYKQRRGRDFDLREFHDQLLTQGAMPIPLARKLLLHE